jgi:hypothetical protein
MIKDIGKLNGGFLFYAYPYKKLKYKSSRFADTDLSYVIKIAALDNDYNIIGYIVPKDVHRFALRCTDVNPKINLVNIIRRIVRSVILSFSTPS